jgi:anti-repressor protein
MNDLITLNYENDKPTVNGRDLHNALQISTKYADWFKRMCEYGFVEGRDYKTCFSNLGSENHGGQNKIDHQISINMAKQLCMIQRTEIGRKFREYFINIEEAWNSPSAIMERALKIAHKQALEDRKRIMQLEEDKENLQISLNQSLQYYTVAKYNKEFHKKWNLQECKRIGKALTIFCQNRAIRIKKCETNDERFGTVNSYPLMVWKDYLGENS